MLKIKPLQELKFTNPSLERTVPFMCSHDHLTRAEVNLSGARILRSYTPPRRAKMKTHPEGSRGNGEAQVAYAGWKF